MRRSCVPSFAFPAASRWMDVQYQWWPSGTRSNGVNFSAARTGYLEVEAVIFVPQRGESPVCVPEPAPTSRACLLEQGRQQFSAPGLPPPSCRIGLRSNAGPSLNRASPFCLFNDLGPGNNISIFLRQVFSFYFFFLKYILLFIFLVHNMMLGDAGG